jgi:protein TonB
VKTKPTYKDASGKMVYNKAEIDPSFTGGDDAMMQYLRDNINYPADAREKGIEGTVFIDFVVGDNGKVREVVVSDIVGDEDQSLKDEAARVVSSMPTWIPGRQRGEAVDTRFSIPITFQLF